MVYYLNNATVFYTKKLMFQVYAMCIAVHQLPNARPFVLEYSQGET